MAGKDDKITKYNVGFKNDALEKLREVARKLNISEDNLGEVLVKGIKIIDLSLGGKLILEKDNERYEIDIKKL